MGALRFNSGKAKMAYILQFPRTMEAIARIMEFGAAKYFDGNWKQGGKEDSEYLDCMMRHLTKWLDGKKYDDDSGCSHLGMAIWNMLALHQLNHPDEIMDADLFKEKCKYWRAQKDDTQHCNATCKIGDGVEFAIKDMPKSEAFLDLSGNYGREGDSQ